MIAYTIGMTKNYLQVLADHPDDCFKTGKTDDYEGGYIWKTAEEAQAFIDSSTFRKLDWGDGKSREPEKFSVFKVELRNGWDDVSALPGVDGAYNLLVDSRFF